MRKQETRRTHAQNINVHKCNAFYIYIYIYIYMDIIKAQEKKRASKKQDALVYTSNVYVYIIHKFYI